MEMRDGRAFAARILIVTAVYLVGWASPEPAFAQAGAQGKPGTQTPGDKGAVPKDAGAKPADPAKPAEAAKPGQSSKPTDASKQPDASKPAAIPNEIALNLLIKSTIVALNHANMTGNYSVLRDLATPRFREANSIARISAAFRNLRERNIDLSAIMLTPPKLRNAPEIDKDGVLRLQGFFLTSPQRVIFELAFKRVGERWRVAVISVDAAPLKEANAKQGADKSNGKQQDKAPEKKGDAGASKPTEGKREEKAGAEKAK